MSAERISRWLDSELEPELACLLESSAADEPSAEQLRAFETRMALVLAAGAAGAAGAIATSSAAASQAKVATGLAKLGLAWAKVTLAAKLSIAVGAIAVAGSVPVLIKRIEAPAPEGASQLSAKVRTTGRPKPTHSGSGSLLPAAAVIVEEDAPAQVTEVIALPLPSPAPKVSVRGPKTSKVSPSVEAPPPVASAPAASAPAASAPADTMPQLEREVALLKAMRAALRSDPCEVGRLGAQHRASFATPLLGPERDHIEALAHAQGAACPKPEN